MLNIKKIAAAIGAGALIAASFLPALAAETAVVSATVTPGVISVSVSPTSVPYGAMPLNDTKDSLDITATNNGSVKENFDIKAADAEYQEVGEEAALCTDTGVLDKCTWSLASSVGVADQYVHAYTTDLIEPTGTALGLDNEYTTKWVPLAKDPTYKDLANNVVAATGTQSFQLDMRTPASGGGETAPGKEYSTTVTILATWAE